MITDDIRTQFQTWLKGKGCQEKTSKGRPSTIYEYVKRIDRLCDKLYSSHTSDEWEKLAQNIDSVLVSYYESCNQEYYINKYNLKDALQYFNDIGKMCSNSDYPQANLHFVYNKDYDLISSIKICQIEDYLRIFDFVLDSEDKYHSAKIDDFLTLYVLSYGGTEQVKNFLAFSSQSQCTSFSDVSICIQYNDKDNAKTKAALIQYYDFLQISSDSFIVAKLKDKRNDNEIKLTTYDLEIGIEYIMDCTVEEQGSTVVNAIMFSEIIRKLPDTEIKIYLDDNNLLVIECEGSLYKLATMDPTEFPELPKINIENSIQIEQNVLKNMIRRTIFAVSNEENRPIFTGCLFEVINNKLNVVAVDGFRLAWRSSYLNVQANDFSAVIPGKTLNEVNKIISDSFEPIKIGISKNQALFDMDNCKIVTRVLDGEFLNYANVIPNEWDTRIRVNKNILQSCFERISLISSSSVEKEKKYPVRVMVDIGKLTISCANQTGDAKEEIYVSTEGKNIEAGFNPKYFLDALKVIDDEEVYVHFGSSISPCIIRPVDEGDYVYMILPIRLKD